MDFKLIFANRVLYFAFSFYFHLMVVAQNFLRPSKGETAPLQLAQANTRITKKVHFSSRNAQQISLEFVQFYCLQKLIG